MLRSLGTARAKRIRRRLETIGTDGEYLATKSDERETILLSRTRRRLVDLGEAVRRAIVDVDLLIEADRTDENVRHMAIWRESQYCNREVGECEEPDATEPVRATPALAMG